MFMFMSIIVFVMAGKLNDNTCLLCSGPAPGSLIQVELTDGDGEVMVRSL